MLLAHLSDPHLALPTPRWRDLGRELVSKRALGFINWHRKRRFIHRADILAALMRDLSSQRADHVACTGDLVNIALREEFAAARNFLETLGPPRDVTLVPGNHDAYVRAAADWPRAYWGDYMQGDDAAPPAFPFVRRRGAVAIVGLSSAVPTRAFRATGRLGDAQIARLAELLSALAAEKLFRVVLIHHPPLSPPSHRAKWLEDAAALRGILADRGAELVLHGHDHVHELTWLDGPEARIPAIGVPSASACPGGHHEAASYNLYRIKGQRGAWQCGMVSRGMIKGEWRSIAQRELF